MQQRPPLCELCGFVEPLDRSSVNALRKYEKEFIRLTSKQQELTTKVNTILSYIMRQNATDLQFQTSYLGGYGFKFSPEQHNMPPICDDALIRFQLILPQHGLFIYGYAQVKLEDVSTDSDQLPKQPEDKVYTARFKLISSEDQEAIFHTVTQIQLVALRIRAQQRADSNDQS